MTLLRFAATFFAAVLAIFTIGGISFLLYVYWPRKRD